MHLSGDIDSHSRCVFPPLGLHPSKVYDEKRVDALEIEGTYSISMAGMLRSDGQQDEVPHPRVSFVTAVLLGAALSLHSILEGLALGSQSTLHSSEDIMLAIFAHKGLAAYALGASLMDSRTSAKRFWMIVLSFAIASPLGILMGKTLILCLGKFFILLH